MHPFLSIGADVNMANKDGNTALLLACTFNHLDAVESLIEAGMYQLKDFYARNMKMLVQANGL